MHFFPKLSSRNANENGEISYIDRKFLATTSTFFQTIRSETRREENTRECTRDKMSTSSVYKVYEDRLPAILDRQMEKPIERWRNFGRVEETREKGRKWGEKDVLGAPEVLSKYFIWEDGTHNRQVSGLGLRRFLDLSTKGGRTLLLSTEKREGD